MSAIVGPVISLSTIKVFGYMGGCLIFFIHDLIKYIPSFLVFFWLFFKRFE